MGFAAFLGAVVACGNTSDPGTRGPAGSGAAGVAGSGAAGVAGSGAAGVAGSGAAGVAGSGAAGVAGSDTAGVAGSDTVGGAGSGVAGEANSGGMHDGVAGHGGAVVGSAGGGAGGASAGGSAGAVSSGGPFDPTVAIPSHDCRSDTGANCISVAGNYNGADIDVYCNPTSDVSVTIHAGKWVIGCDHLMPGFARIDIEVAPPGNFSEQMSAGSKPATEFEFSTGATPNSAVALSNPNLAEAEVAGTITAMPGNHRVVSGTFHGKWSPPLSTCKSLSSSACVEATLNVTFRLNSSYGYCFSNDDCVAPLTCDPIAFACFN